MLEIVEGSRGWRFISVTDDNLDEAMEYLDSHRGLLALYLDSAHCSEALPLLIAEHPRRELIRAISLMNDWKDVSALQRLKWLRSISFGYDNAAFDFIGFEKLESLGGVWSKKWINLDNVQLKRFAVSKFKLGIEGIPNLDNIEEVSLIQPSLESLTGIEKASRIEYLELVRGGKLEDIADLRNCAKTLRTLTFDKCRKVCSFAPVGELLNLRTLLIQDCGSMESISIIAGMPLLTILGIVGTAIEDYDMSYCIRHPSLKELRAEEKGAYRPPVHEVKRVLKNRQVYCCTIGEGGEL